MTRTRKVIIESKYMEPIGMEAEIAFVGTTVKGRLLNLTHEKVALLLPTADPNLSICEQAPSVSYHFELLDQDGNFVAQPSGIPTAWAELGDPLSQQHA